MPAQFDTNAEDEKLRFIREEEEEDLTRILSEKYGITYTDLSIMPINGDALRIIPEQEATAAGVIPFDKNGKHLSLALRNPQNPEFPALLKKLEQAGYTVMQFLISERSFARGIERYRDLSQASETQAGVFTIPAAELAELTQKLTSVSALRAYLNDTRAASTQISTIFEGVLAAAYVIGASDIHFEPEELLTRMRLRLDGVLTDVFEFDAHAYRLLNSRIKLLSGLKLNISDRAQDGRFSVAFGASDVEVRTSVIPGNYGESIVLRILDPSAISHKLSEMGIPAKLLERLEKEIRRPNGMLLTTGPTGSGKTTTLYAFLKEIYTPDIKIVTLEDPIEYHLPGIVQTQTNAKDYTFASGLRSILRQDPDVIMVGEIRDADVAETAVQAALTGHFVFTTLHTNDAAGAFPRLADLGVDPKTMPSAVTVAMAQRLVRTLNQETRSMRPTTDEEKALITRVFSTLTDPSLMPASIDEVGAPNPKDEYDTGYKGRVGVFEAIFMDDELAELLRTNPADHEIAKSVLRQGYLTMAQDGLLKALSGLTSLEEIMKVVGMPQG